MIKIIIKMWFIVMWGPLKTDKVPKMQFPKYRKWNISVAMCEFEIRVISNEILNS